MSVTFSLASAETLYPSCLACGKSAHDPVYTVCEREDCLGYGPDPVSNTPSLNVAQGNAYALLRLLGIDAKDDELWGELEPATVKRELALASARIRGEVRPLEVNGNVFSFGLGEAQFERYCTVMLTLAELAERRGEPICYG